MRLAQPYSLLTIIDLEERVLRHDSAPDLWRDLARLAGRPGCHALYLSLSRVEYITAGGLGRLVALRNRLAAFGGDLGLLNVSPLSYEILHVTGLTSLMVVRPKEPGPSVRPGQGPPFVAGGGR